MELARGEFGRLADWIGDTPESAISRHLLARGLARAYIASGAGCIVAALVQATGDPGEPVGFGSDGRALWALLREASGWFCVSVSADAAPALGALMATETGKPVRYYGDVYHVLTAPAVECPHEAVRRLDLADVGLLAAARPALRVSGWGNDERLLAEGIAAGAVVDGRLVAVAATSARTERHADIAVATVEAMHGRGLATAAASLVARAVQDAGQTPVWSAGEGNLASLRVARKLGFVEIGRRVYVIREGIA